MITARTDFKMKQGAIIFRVRRTSLADYSKPCEEAWDGITGVHPEWYVVIQDLEALVQFSHKYGRLILEGTELEIYDD